MTLTPEKREELEVILKPAVKWLNDNCHPHVTLLVEPTGARLVEGVAGFRIEEYIRD